MFTYRFRSFTLPQFCKMASTCTRVWNFLQFYVTQYTDCVKGIPDLISFDNIRQSVWLKFSVKTIPWQGNYNGPGFPGRVFAKAPSPYPSKFYSGIPMSLVFPSLKGKKFVTKWTNIVTSRGGRKNSIRHQWNCH